MRYDYPAPNPQFKGKYNLLYRTASAPCNSSNYSCLALSSSPDNFPDYYWRREYITPQLTAGVTYDFMVELVDTTIFTLHNSTWERIWIDFKCIVPSNINASVVGTDYATIEWQCNSTCNSTTYLEYGPSGFTPGSGSTAGVNGTVISNAASPVSINGLSPNTTYDIYIRYNCGNGLWNSPKYSFHTSPLCTGLRGINCGDLFHYTSTTALFSSSWNGYNCGPSGVTGVENMWVFTPSSSGTAILSTQGASFNVLPNWQISFYYKPVTGSTCDNTGWTCIGSAPHWVNSSFNLGPLVAGSSYYILADAPSIALSNGIDARITCAGSCSPPLLTGISAITTVSAKITGLCNACPGAAIIEYGPPGFTPGSDTLPGAGGTVVKNVAFPYTINGLNTATTYDVYARWLCSNNIYSSNSAKISFATLCDVAPTSITASATTVCLGTSVTLTQSGGTLLSAGADYKWYVSNNLIGTGASINVTPIAATTFQVRIESSCGNSNFASRTINVTALPTVSISTPGTTSLCVSPSIPLTATASGTGISYQWQNNNANIAGATSLSYSATQEGSYVCVVKNSGACSAVSNIITVTGVGTLSPFSITGTTGFCRSSTNNIYSISPVQSGVTFNWTFPSGASIVSGQGTASVTVSFSSNAAAGNISVTASNNCGTASSSKAIVLRSSNPSTPGSVAGSNVGCNGDSKLYTIRKVANADYYIWTPPVGATINGSSAPYNTPDTGVVVVYGAAFAGDTLRVKSSSCRGISAERKLRINKTNPSTPGTISGLNVGLCNLSGIIYSVNTVSNATSYTWRTNIAGATINGSASPVTITSPTATINFGIFTTGQIYVKANNGCGSSAERSLTVNAKPAVPSSITGPTALCTNQTGINYTTVAVNNASSYNWIVPSGCTINSGQGTTAMIMTARSTPATGTVRVRSQNSCANSAYLSKSVTVSSCPRLKGESVDQLSIEAYPNPVNAILYISLETEKSDNLLMTITDLEGRTIKSWTSYINTGKTTLETDVHELSSGIYLLNIFNSANKKQTLRIAVE